jgi:thiol-disulfide isomerase/thioredoxin
MKKILFLLILISCSTFFGYSQKLTIIEQDFNEAIKLAKQENKLLFIDFYTTWCEPCKKMDKLFFQNDSLSQLIADDFILLRYNAENDSVFHLSKKHHVSSYPTGLILNKNKYVVNRKYGFSGEDAEELSENIIKFTNISIDLNHQNKFLRGYSNIIDVSKYPQFYIDYVNRDNTKVTSTEEFKSFWNKKHDILSEEYFSPLVYFATDVPTTTANNFLKNKEKYTELYGETDVNIALFFLSIGQFEFAITTKSQEKFDEATAFSIQAMGEESAKQLLSNFEKKFAESKVK